MKKVMVAMSGGVDSSVAALLLKRAGYEVIGATMRLWAQAEENQTCGSSSAVDDARQVAEHLNIPHYIFDFHDEFSDLVVQDFCREYTNGRTPNPCVVCNRNIKFDLLLRESLALGADFLATGHYARISGEDGQFYLLKGLDESKDQSYVLYSLTQYQLSHILFPLGTWSKPAIRYLAREAGLPVAEKSESQDICFIPDGRCGRFVAEHSSHIRAEGSFRYVDGRFLGKHSGIHNYTIGQRKGLGLALGHPVFVAGIDPVTDTVWIGEDQDLRRLGLEAEKTNYISGTPFATPTRVSAKIRYSARPAEAVAVSLENGRIRIDFAEPQRAITPGQSVVFYDGERLLGGAIIERSL